MKDFKAFLKAIAAHWKVALTGATLTIGGLVWQLVAWAYPKTPSPSYHGWMVWLPGLCITFFAAFRAWSDEHRRAESAEHALVEHQNCQPRLRFAETRWTPLFGRVPSDPPGVHPSYIYHALEVWLKNEPERRNEHSVAKNVSVAVSFSCEGQTTPLFRFPSQWVLPSDPDLAGFENHQSAIDIPPNDVPAKVVLVLQQHRANDENCYAHPFGKLQGAPDGRHEPFRLVPGRYRCDLELRGENLDQRMSFIFTNNGLDTPPTLVPVTSARCRC
jgi:hypothetical protein